MSGGPVALVTGAASGIGLALAEELVATGARVVLTDLDGDALRRAAERLPADRVSTRVLDVTDARAFADVVATTVREAGRIDLLFNNAGIGLTGDVRDMTLAQWRPLVDVNLWGVIHGVHAVYPHMLRQESGHIVNIASGAGLLPRPGMTAYAATKHAVVGLSTSLRAEASPHGVKVTAICPGYIKTAIMDRATYVRLDGEALRKTIPVRPMSAQACARRILRAVRRDRALVVISKLTWLEWLLYRFVPPLGRLLALWRGKQIAAHRLTAPAAPLLESSP